MKIYVGNNTKTFPAHSSDNYVGHWITISRKIILNWQYHRTQSLYLNHTYDIGFLHYLFSRLFGLPHCGRILRNHRPQVWLSKTWGKITRAHHDDLLWIFTHVLSVILDIHSHKCTQEVYVPCHSFLHLFACVKGPVDPDFWKWGQCQYVSLSIHGPNLVSHTKEIYIVKPMINISIGHFYLYFAWLEAFAIKVHLIPWLRKPFSVPIGEVIG